MLSVVGSESIESEDAMIDAMTARQTAIYYLGLAELVETRLAASLRYAAAVHGLDGAWQWVERQDISGAALADMVSDEDAGGVYGAMAVEERADLLPVWGCVAMGVAFASYAASLSEGKTMRQIREDIHGVDSEDSHDEFARWFQTLIPLTTVRSHYEAAMDDLFTGEVTRSATRDCAFAALHAAAADSGA